MLTRSIRRRGGLVACLTVLTFAMAEPARPSVAAGPTAPSPGFAIVAQINAQLAAQHAPYRLEGVDFLTRGEGLPSIRLHRFPWRWVPNDPRRFWDAPGEDLSYLFDQSDGATTSGLTAAQTEPAFDAAINTWGADSCLRNMHIVKHADTGADPDIFDAWLGVGDLGFPYADITFAGFAPQQLIEAYGPNLNILAFSLSFDFVDADGNTTDINHDNYADTALNEIYVNDYDGDAPFPAPWGINVSLLQGKIDFQSVVLHELGHSLGLAHFGGPPVAVMNNNASFWEHLSQSLYPPDHGSLCAQLGSSPH